MAADSTDSTTAISGGAVLSRRRGKSKGPNFKYDGPVSVIRLDLDASDPLVRRRLQRQWDALFRLRRALQRDAADRCRAYWAARHERQRDPKALRERLGLTRKGIETTAKAHIEASGWLRDHLTKAIGLHVADEVWETIDRNLFADASGRRHGPPRVGSWWKFSRVPGRAPTLGYRNRHRHCGGRPVSGHLDPGPADSAGCAGAASRRLVVGSRRCVGGGIHRPARRGSRTTSAATPRRWPVGAPGSFPGRTEYLAQDRPGAGA